MGIVGGACSDVAQEFLEVEGKKKRSQLEKILADPARDPTERILIFVQTKKNADFLGTDIDLKSLGSPFNNGVGFVRFVL